MVELRRKQFLRRMSRRFLNGEASSTNDSTTSEQQPQFDENGNEVFSQRRTKALGRLNNDDVADNWRSQNRGSKRRDKGLGGEAGAKPEEEDNNGVAKPGGFAIFDDGADDNNSSNDNDGDRDQNQHQHQQRAFVREGERKKENEMEVR